MCNWLSLTEEVVELYRCIPSPEGKVTLNHSGNLLGFLFASTYFSDGISLIILSINKLFLHYPLGISLCDVNIAAEPCALKSPMSAERLYFIQEATLPR